MFLPDGDSSASPLIFLSNSISPGPQLSIISIGRNLSSPFRFIVIPMSGGYFLSGSIFIKISVIFPTTSSALSMTFAPSIVLKNNMGMGDRIILFLLLMMGIFKGEFILRLVLSLFDVRVLLYLFLKWKRIVKIAGPGSLLLILM